jgi:chorismate mutase/prephenate dehydratase
MSDVAPSLAQLRAEIDRIDDELLSLLERRVAIGRRVAAAKGDASGPYLRPGREAAILRRLNAASSDDLPTATLERIWREILGANLARQVDPLTVVFAPSGAESIVDLARDRGGAATRLELVDTADAAIEAAVSGRATLVILPDIADGRWRWWPMLLRAIDPKPRVIARLPLFGATDSPAYGLAAQDPDPSGDDVTLYATPGAAAGAVDTVEIDGTMWSLVAADGYLDALHMPAGAVLIGTYARPETSRPLTS